MQEKIQVAGIVVIYNPVEEEINNIGSYISNLDRLYIIDNSEKIHKIDYEKFTSTKVEYFFCGENLGIAAALNKGIDKAIKDHFKYCILFDQDTYAEANLIPVILKYIMLNQTGDIGIYASIPEYNSILSKKVKNSEKINFAITSGSLISLDIFQKVGAFLDKLFIDYIDFEYCLRLKKNGYKIVQLKDVFIQHNLGKIVGRKSSYLKEYSLLIIHQKDITTEPGIAFTYTKITFYIPHLLL